MFHRTPWPGATVLDVRAAVAYPYLPSTVTGRQVPGARPPAGIERRKACAFAPAGQTAVSYAPIGMWCFCLSFVTERINAGTRPESSGLPSNRLNN